MSNSVKIVDYPELVVLELVFMSLPSWFDFPLPLPIAKPCLIFSETLLLRLVHFPASLRTLPLRSLLLRCCSCFYSIKRVALTFLQLSFGAGRLLSSLTTSAPFVLCDLQFQPFTNTIIYWLLCWSALGAKFMHGLLIFATPILL